MYDRESIFMNEARRRRHARKTHHQGELGLFSSFSTPLDWWFFSRALVGSRDAKLLGPMCCQIKSVFCHWKSPLLVKSGKVLVPIGSMDWYIYQHLADLYGEYK